VPFKGDSCIVSKIAMRWQQRAAMISQGEGKLHRTPFRRGCSRKERVDKYGDIYGTNREFPWKGNFEDNTYVYSDNFNCVRRINLFFQYAIARKKKQIFILSKKHNGSFRND